MNKKIHIKQFYVFWSILLILVMFAQLGGLFGTVFVYADTTESEEEVSIEETINLGLEDAYEKIKESTTWELLESENTADSAAAKGYSESYSSSKNNEETERTLSTKQLQLQKTFAASILDSNKTARINNLNKEIFDMYFTLQNQNKKVEIESENLDIKKELLQIAEKKYELGTVAKTDVLNAELAVMESENSYTSSKNKLEQLKLEFNSYFGYELQQKLVLTDNITEKALPETTLEEAIALAIENRLEIKSAAYNLEMQELNFSNYKAYPTLSSKYLSANNSLLKAQLNNEQVDEEIEIDVRSKFIAMQEKYDAVEIGKKSKSNAEEALMIEKARYESGLSTLNEVQQAQVTLYNAEFSNANALLSYNLSVEEFNLSIGVGMNPVNL